MLHRPQITRTINKQIRNFAANNVDIVSILGFPMFHGQGLVGTQLGPKAMRERRLIERIKKLGFIVEDHGDVDISRESSVGPKGKFTDVVGKGCEKVADLWAKIANDESRFMLTLGGDHSIATSTLTARLKTRPDCGIIWVDAHADIHDPSSSASGNFHGMPVGLTMQFMEPAKIPYFEWISDYPMLKPEQIVYIGLREVDLPERRRIRENNIKAFTMHDIDKFGISSVMDQTLEHLGDVPLHCSFDIDACDPVFAGSTGTTVRGGLSFRESSFIMESLAHTSRLLSLDMVEVNPLVLKEDSLDTTETAVSLIESALGASIL